MACRVNTTCKDTRVFYKSGMPMCLQMVCLTDKHLGDIEHRKNYSEHFPYQFPQYHHPIICILVKRLAETEADTVVVMGAYGKYPSGHDGDMVLHGFGPQFERIDPGVELHP